MNTWIMPIVDEVCVGMEVTSYESVDLDEGWDGLTSYEDNGG